jgi:hypothetical protein
MSNQNKPQLFQSLGTNLVYINLGPMLEDLITYLYVPLSCWNGRSYASVSKLKV